MNNSGDYSISVCFIYGLEEKDSKSEVTFAVCRLPLTLCLTSRMLEHCGRERELVSFDPLHVTRSPPIGKRI